MKHVIWCVRFWYVAWMIPAGVEHFYHIFPQPGANRPNRPNRQASTAISKSFRIGTMIIPHDKT